MLRSTLVPVACLALTAPVLAQSSELFILDQINANIYVMQGGSIVRSFSTGFGSTSPIAVAGTIRTTGISSGTQGGEFDLAGNYLNTTFTQQGGGSYYDGTTDGRTYNYSVNVGDGFLTRFDRNWQNPQPLFQTAGGTGRGTAFDPQNNTVWVISNTNARIYQYDLNGSEVSSFPINTDGQGDIYFLALDPADGRLWFTDEDYTMPLRAYDRSGNFLQDIPNPGVSTNVYGAEFNIPAPGAGALLAAGALAAARRRRA